FEAICRSTDVRVGVPERIFTWATRQYARRTTRISTEMANSTIDSDRRPGPNVSAWVNIG
ncbi:hypothetical protein, partial [Streptomyces doebereineriae]